MSVLLKHYLKFSNLLLLFVIKNSSSLFASMLNMRLSDFGGGEEFRTLLLFHRQFTRDNERHRLFY